MRRHRRAPCAKQAPTDAVAIMSDLICCYSTAAVTCIWYIDFLPRHSLGPLVGAFFSKERGVVASVPSVTVQGYNFQIQTLSLAVC